MPYPIFVSEKYAKLGRDMGLAYDDTSWTSETPAKVVEDAAREANAFFFSPLSQYRMTCPNDCFYDFDSHLNPKGQRFFADTLYNYLIKLSSENKINLE